MTQDKKVQIKGHQAHTGTGKVIIIPPHMATRKVADPHPDSPAGMAQAKAKTGHQPPSPEVLAKMAQGMPKAFKEKLAPYTTPKEKPSYPNAVKHPRAGEDGEIIVINEPHAPTDVTTWDNPEAVATWTPGSPLPSTLNGIPLAPWTPPETMEEWDEVEGQDYSIDEPAFGDSKKAPAAGVVIEEPDGRVWVIHPTNAFGGYKGTFPKGHLEPGMDLQATAIKEAWEESGLKVEITGHLIDVERTTTVARYYTAKRTGGTPAGMGWETQAVSLVPRSKLYEVLNRHVDHPTAEKLGAGTPPKPPAPPKWGPWNPKPKAGFADEGVDYNPAPKEPWIF